MSDTDWTVLLSGPLASRASLLATLDRAGVDVRGSQTLGNRSRGLPDDDPTVGWITARHVDVDEVVSFANGVEGWALRMHWATPACRVCTGAPIARDTCTHCEGTGRTEKPAPRAEDLLADALRRIAALEAAR